jgi:hypothetical protein
MSTKKRTSSELRNPRSKRLTQEIQRSDKDEGVALDLKTAYSLVGSPHISLNSLTFELYSALFPEKVPPVNNFLCALEVSDKLDQLKIPLDICFELSHEALLELVTKTTKRYAPSPSIYLGARNILN